MYAMSKLDQILKNCDCVILRLCSKVKKLSSDVNDNLLEHIGGPESEWAASRHESSSWMPAQ